MAVQDILLDENNDLDIVNGDFLVGPSDNQHLQLIVELFEGSLKKYPLQGVGISQYLASTATAGDIRRSLGVKAGADGYQNIKIELKTIGDIFIYKIQADRP